jgi:hypothetical protein
MMSNNDDDEDFTLCSGSPDERWLTNFFGSNRNEGNLENTNTHSIHPNNNHATADNTHVIHAVSQSQLSQGETTETSVNATKGRPKNDNSSPHSTPDQRKKQKVNREDTDDDDDMILQQVIANSLAVISDGVKPEGDDKPSESCVCCAGTGPCSNRNNTTIRYSSHSDCSQNNLSSMMSTLDEHDLELIKIGTGSAKAVVFPCARTSFDDECYDNEESQILKVILGAMKVVECCDMTIYIVNHKYIAAGVKRYVGFGASPAFQQLKNDILQIQKQGLLKDVKNIWLMFNDVLRIGLDPSHLKDVLEELNKLDGVHNIEIQTVRQFDLGTGDLKETAAINKKLNELLGNIHEKSTHVNAAKDLSRSFENLQLQKRIDKCMRKNRKLLDHNDKKLNTLIDNAHKRTNLLPQGGSDYFDFLDNLCINMDKGVISSEDGVVLFLKYINENFQDEKKDRRIYRLCTTACSHKSDSNKTKKTANDDDSAFQVAYIFGFHEARGLPVSDEDDDTVILTNNQRQRRGVCFPEIMALGLLAVGCELVIDNTVTTSTRVSSFLWRNKFFNGVHEATSTPLHSAQHVGVTNDLTNNPDPTCYQVYALVANEESKRIEDEMKAYERAKKKHLEVKANCKDGNIIGRIKDSEERAKFRGEMETISDKRITNKIRVGINNSLGVNLFMTDLTTSEKSISAERILQRKSFFGNDNVIDEIIEGVTTKVALTNLDAGESRITEPRGCDVKMTVGSFLPNQWN